MVDDVEWKRETCGGSYVVCGGFQRRRMTFFNLTGIPEWRLRKRLDELWPAECLSAWHLRERDAIDVELQRRSKQP